MLAMLQPCACNAVAQWSGPKQGQAWPGGPQEAQARANGCHCTCTAVWQAMAALMRSEQPKMWATETPCSGCTMDSVIGTRSRAGSGTPELEVMHLDYRSGCAPAAAWKLMPLDKRAAQAWWWSRVPWLELQSSSVLPTHVTVLAKHTIESTTTH